jgi:hypothetical protein
VNIGKAISIELDDGQRLSLSLKEAEELHLKLAKMLKDNRGRKSIGEVERGRGRPGRRKNTAGKTARAAATKLSIRRKARGSPAVGMSDEKRQEILIHLNKEVSETPRTLTNLLKGTSYSPSQIPLIRSLIENQENIAAKTKGKRTLYLKKK